MFPFGSGQVPGWKYMYLMKHFLGQTNVFFGEYTGFWTVPLINYYNQLVKIPANILQPVHEKWKWLSTPIDLDTHF